MPLLLFYGLSQAGRAVAACATSVVSDFRLMGHGIRSSNMEQADLGEVLVRSEGDGSFTRICRILSSPSLPDSAQLRDMWALIPEVALWPLRGSIRQLLTVSIEPSASGQLRAMVSGMPRSLVREVPVSMREEKVRAYLSNYTSLNGFAFRTPGVYSDERGSESRNDHRDTFGCRLVWDLDGRTPEEAFDRIAPFYHRALPPARSRRIHPAVAGATDQFHPVVVWWTVLYTLSMLARYQPDRWTAHIDVNSGENAAAIEVLLGAARSAVPELILAAIADVTV